MRYTLEEKKRIAHAAINETFRRSCLKELKRFSLELRQRIEDDIELQLMTGMDVQMQREPLVINIAEPSKQLYDVIIALLDDE